MARPLSGRCLRWSACSPSASDSGPIAQSRVRRCDELAVATTPVQKAALSIPGHLHTRYWRVYMHSRVLCLLERQWLADALRIVWPGGALAIVEDARPSSCIPLRDL